MPFTMTKPTSNTDYGDRTVWPSGTHDFKLVEAQAGIFTPKNSQYGTDPYPAARFIFEDEEGDRLELRAERFPKEFQYNEKSNFLKQVGALYGRKLTAEDALVIDIPGWEEWDDWTSLPHYFKKDNTPTKIKSLMINDEEIMVPGRVVSIVLEETTYEDRDGNDRPVNNIINVLPKIVGGGSKKKSGGKALDLPE